MATSTEREQATAERRQQVVALYAGGMSVADVANRLGCHPQTARADLRVSGVAIRGTNQPQTTPRPCAHCGEMFRPSPKQLRDGYGKYHSRKCGGEAHRIHRQPEERICARGGCEKPFTPEGFNVSMGWGKYCSTRCSALSTGAHVRKRGREVACLNCGETEWRYDSQIIGNEFGVFCSSECWGKYRWKEGIRISPDVVSLARGGARQKWYGRWNAHKGAAGGIEGGREGGRPPKATKGQAVECWRLHAEGRSTREIAAAVFGDARYKDRVARLLR